MRNFAFKKLRDQTIGKQLKNPNLKNIGVCDQIISFCSQLQSLSSHMVFSSLTWNSLKSHDSASLSSVLQQKIMCFGSTIFLNLKYKPSSKGLIYTFSLFSVSFFFLSVMYFPVFVSGLMFLTSIHSSSFSNLLELGALL